ncbi:flagellar motor switch protein FliG [Nocardioides aequoreus]|uniref:flagellar motor switch protein FliG n=1 Tax=Nocardioides aequoreus TaxID=397278 RepID=UPI0004C42EB5|nr:flagellar motor switch protein FliG [Nocardioides aequoreus]
MPATMTTNGARKAAIVLIQLGPERAATVLSRLSETEVEAVTSEIARLKAVEAEESSQVLSEFRDLAMARAHIATGGLDFAKSLLEQSLGPERAAAMVERLQAVAIQLPFQFLHQADPMQLRSFIADEHPQLIALVMAHMTADKASMLLAGLPPQQQADVAHRLAVMDRTSPDIVKIVEARLERRMSSMLQPSSASRVGGIDPLVNIINRSDRSTERQIVEGLESLDAALAEELKSRMFMFEDIVTIDDRSMQLVLRQVDTGQLALALKGVADAVRGKITGNLSERAATDLLEEIDILGPVRLSQVEEAQQLVIQTIRELEEQGQITIHRGGDDDLVV